MGEWESRGYSRLASPMTQIASKQANHKRNDKLVLRRHRILGFEIVIGIAALSSLRHNATAYELNREKAPFDKILQPEHLTSQSNGLQTKVHFRPFEFKLVSVRCKAVSC